ncbi:MAG: site-specific integrase [Pseudomonadota bacterium]|nr:site-specific integrase [Pseudomonadota bacterium]
MAIELLRTVFAWAMSERIIAANPCAHIRSIPSGTRNLILERAEDYARLFRTLDRMEREKRLRAPVADAVRLIALTGCRRGEIANLRWAHVDLKLGLITLPPAAHKAGRRTGKPRIIGLPSLAQRIISRQTVGNPDSLVFQPAQGWGPLNLSHPWRKVRAEAGLPEGIGLHGLRHSLASHMAMNGAEAAEIMTALGHSQLSTAQRYVHWAQDARQALAERAASVVAAGMAAAADDTEGAVVSIATANRGKKTERS